MLARNLIQGRSIQTAQSSATSEILVLFTNTINRALSECVSQCGSIMFPSHLYTLLMPSHEPPKVDDGGTRCPLLVPQLCYSHVIHKLVF